MTVNRCRNIGSTNTSMISATLTSYKRGIATQEITKNLILFSEDKANVDKDPKTLR